MANELILIIEDETDIAELIRYNLEREGYRVNISSTGEKGIKEACLKAPDAVILDLMLPGIDGLDVCRSLRNNDKTRNIPILMLTAKSEEADIVTGLEVGADDYITKPFSPRVLLARLRAVLRRNEDTPDEKTIIRIHSLTIDPNRHRVSAGHKNISLTGTEFKLLHTLASRPGWVFNRNQLVDIVRGEDVVITDRTIDVHIAGLRKKLGPAGNHIETIRGIGYRFRE
ncbi:MAG: response regulator [candidate division Zixibacteria bacterium]|nr:response regulator [candidate division Zixibacteria bacterium]MDD5425634.1 response regulator [candidate division Zixibacteria bacterium]